jgi:hypothetical protein
MSKVIGSITGSNSQAKAAKNAADLQYKATQEANVIQKEANEQFRNDLSGYRDAGTTALQQLMGGMGEGGRFNEVYSGQKMYDDPGYQFRLQQGQDSIQSGAAAQGGLLSGATQKALANYGQEFASQEYGNAYNRFNADQTNQYNRLANLVGVGQNAAAQTGNAGLQTGQAVANNTMAGANAQAAGVVAAGNQQANNFGALLAVANTASKFYKPV